MRSAAADDLCLGNIGAYGAHGECPQRGHCITVILHAGESNLGSLTEGRYLRHSLGAGAHAALLSAAANEGLDFDPCFDIQCAYALRRVDLMAAYAYHVRAELFCGKGHLHKALNGVGMQKSLRAAALEHFCYSRNVGNAAGLVVYHHKRHKDSILTQSCLYRVRGNRAVLFGGEISHLKAAALKLLKRFSHRIVLNGGGDDVSAASCGAFRASCYCPDVALRAAGGEINLRCRAAERRGYLSARGVEICLCIASLRVRRARVSVAVGHDLIRNIGGLGANACRCRIIKIDFRFFHISYSSGDDFNEIHYIHSRLQGQPV